MAKMGASSSQVQRDEANDAPTAPAAPVAPAGISNESENTSKPTKKSPRTYSKRKRQTSPMTMARLLNPSITQEQVTVSSNKKRRRGDKENDAEEEDSAALLSGKENREPGSSSAGSYSSSEEQGTQKDEPKSSPPPMMKKQKVQPVVVPPSPPPTQQQQQSGSASKPKNKSKKALNRKDSQHTLELRLSLPEQSFRPGHINEKNEKKTGWFSPEEIKTLEKYKEDFCKENVIDGDTFDQCVQSSIKDRVALFKRNLSHMGINEFWNQIYERLPRRDRRSIARFMRRHFQPGHKKPHQWTEEDDDELERLHRQHGPKWTMIAAEMERTHDDVVQRWKNKVEHRSTMRGGPWSREEFEKLIQVLEKSREFLAADNKSLDVGKDIYEMDDKYVSWGAVSDFLGNTRSRQQCADKWRKIRAKVADSRQTGSKDATYLEVYDFSGEPKPFRKKKRSRSELVSRKTLAMSQDFVYSDEEEEEEEEENGGDSDRSDAASDDDNLSALGQLPPQQQQQQSFAEGSSNNENQEEADSDSNNALKPPNSSSAEPDILSFNNILADETPTTSQPKKHKHKRSKAEKAEAKAARKAERKAARKAARKEARRAQKRALRDTTTSSSSNSSGEAVSIKRESTQESSQV